MAAKVACPKCGRKQVNVGAEAHYWCPKCKGYFDNDPDEGGDYSNNPTKRAEWAERKKENGRKPFKRY